jgi:hypothetical protein
MQTASTEEVPPPSSDGLEWIGEYLVDVTTGEIVRMREPSGFSVHDRATAEWVLERRLEAQMELTAVQRRREVILENLSTMERQAQHRLDWLDARFRDELEAFARKELEGKKSRSWLSPFGRLSFRKVKAQLVVDNEAEAIEWGERQMPQTVKVTKKFLVSQVEGDAIPAGCHVAPARESFRVVTGQSS